MQPSLIITDKYHQTRHFAGEMYSTICVQWAADHLGLYQTQTDPLLTKICAKNDFYIFVLSDLDLWPLDLKFASAVILVERYVCTKLEVSAAFVLRKIGGTWRTTDRQTDRVQRIMQSLPERGPHNNLIVSFALMLSPRGQSGLEGQILASVSKLWPRPSLYLVVLLCNRAFFKQKSCKIREFW